MIKSKLLQRTINSSKSYVSKNAPTILTYIGAAGVIATSVSAVKASKKYEKLVSDSSYESGDAITAPEKLRIGIRVFAPTAFIGISTISCIFGSNAMNKHRQAAITSAYMLLDASYKEYKNKAKEIYGDDADDRIMSDIIRKQEIPEDVLMYGEQKLFYEPYSRLYFNSTIAEVQKAEYELNRKLVTEDGVRLNDFYELLGIEKTDIGEVLGWSTYSGYELYELSWIDFNHIKTDLEGGMECYAIQYPQEPRMDFMDF